jgi:hypothetical protein
MLPSTVEPTHAVMYGMPPPLKRSMKRLPKKRIHWSKPLVTSINGKHIPSADTQPILLRITRDKKVAIPVRHWNRYAVLKNEQTAPVLHAVNTPHMQKLLAKQNIVCTRIGRLDPGAPIGYERAVDVQLLQRLLHERPRSSVRTRRGTPKRACGHSQTR